MYLAEEEFNTLCGSLRVFNSHVSSIPLVPHVRLQDQEQSPRLLLLQLRKQDLWREVIFYLTDTKCKGS